MIEKVASHCKSGENNDFYDDLNYVFFCDFGIFSAGRQYKTIFFKNNGYINELFENQMKKWKLYSKLRQIKF